MLAATGQKFLGAVEIFLSHNPRISPLFDKHFQLTTVDMHPVILSVVLLVDDCAIGSRILDDAENSILLPSATALCGDVTCFQILCNPPAAFTSKEASVDLPDDSGFAGIDDEVAVN